MKIYIAGKITGNPNYKRDFGNVEKMLKREGHTTINPSILPKGFEWSEYIHICKAMIDVCHAVYLLNSWKDSQGATVEKSYAEAKGKIILTKGDEI